MARRPPPSVRAAHLSTEQMVKGVERLNRRVLDLEAFDPTSVSKRWAPETKALEAAIDEALQRTFGADTVEYVRYHQAGSLDRGPVFMGGGETPPSKVHEYLSAGKENALAIIRQAIRGLQEEIGDSAPPLETKSAVIPAAKQFSQRVFVAHGHDNEAKEAVARFLECLGFEAVVLHEKANQGRTVIEKVEAYSDVDFAVVLLTPDDLGKAKNDTELEARARQNVLLELGFFIGKLGRSNVCALRRGQIEFPSDFAGVVWSEFDVAGAWKTALGRELQAAGHTIDWNRIMAG